jgi:hypothetical protein
MGAGSGSGSDGRHARLGLSLFVRDDGGYTTIAVATALLVSITLTFSIATAEWTLARSADVQTVADAAAMAGANSVAAFATIAQVLDACVLSMGIVGVLVFGVGLVVACIPGARALGAKVGDAGKKILDSRKRFAKSAGEGLRKLEKTLPAVIVANSGSVIMANSQSGISYLGCAIPFPQESKSDYSSLEQSVEADEMEETAEKLRDATDRMEAAKKRADAARERGWRADCVDDPMCLRSRAATLAGLGGVSNPHYSAAELWNFGVPLRRSRAYYARRIARERPDSSGIEEVTDSCSRRAFYEFALGEVNSGWYREAPDETVDLELPELPKNTAEARGTSLYTDISWPCTSEETGVVLHSTLSCPGALGPYVGMASLADVDSGGVGLCAECRMSMGDVGRVAAISTRADNGYEYYWQIVVEASRDYEVARNEQAAAKKEMSELADKGASAFERALEQLAVARPRLCPPGAWGCVAVVGRQSGSATPSELSNSFLAGSDLPAGAAISAAALAPDDATDGNDVLSHLFDGITGERGFSVGGLLGGITGAWGRALVSYGSAYDSVSGAAKDLLGKIDGVFGGTVGSKLSKKIGGIVDKAGFKPADMRMRKPVLVNTQEVFGKAGLSGTAKARSMVQSLPDHGTSLEVARAMGLWAYDQVKDRKFTIAELAIPGTDVTIPLTIDLATLAKLGGLT